MLGRVKQTVKRKKSKVNRIVNVAIVAMCCYLAGSCVVLFMDQAALKSKTEAVNQQCEEQKILNDEMQGDVYKRQIDCYELARQMGFASINMDLIAGLPSDKMCIRDSSITAWSASFPPGSSIYTASPISFYRWKGTPPPALPAAWAFSRCIRRFQPVRGYCKSTAGTKLPPV